MSVIWDSGDYKHYYDNGHWHAITGDTPTDILAQIEELAVVKSATPPTTPEEAEAARVAGIKARLAEIDQRRIRPLAEGDAEYLTALNAEAKALRASL